MVVSTGSKNKSWELEIELHGCWERADVLGGVVGEGPSKEVSREMNELARCLHGNKVFGTEEAAREKALEWEQALYVLVKARRPMGWR